MKLLILGLLPVLIFYFVEDKFGTFWGLVAAVAWAIGECLYSYLRYRKIDRLTLWSTVLTVVLGGLSALLDQSVLFKFQPVIIEVIFAIVLVWGGRGGEPFLFKMMKQTRPEIFEKTKPELVEKQKEMMARMSWHLIILLMGHAVLLSYLAVKGTTGQWAFWKGIGFNVFLFVWAGGEFLFLRLKAKRT